MQVQIENEYTGSDCSEILYFDYEKTAGDVVDRVLSDAGCPYDAEVNIHKCFVLPENIDDFPFTDYDYVVDTVDTVSAKLALITKCQALHVPIISCMGGRKQAGRQSVPCGRYL